MSRIQTVLLAVVFIGAQICCAQPMQGAFAEAEAPMTCPMDRARPCEAQQPTDCENPPELIATASPVPAVHPDVVVLPIALPHPVAHVTHDARDAFWFAQTRTIQLRI